MNPVVMQGLKMEPKPAIPEYIKNDIIYCQRCLEYHKKVYEIMLDTYNRLPRMDEEQKKRNMNEMETIICELRDEQKSLREFLRLVIFALQDLLRQSGAPYYPHAVADLLIKELKTHCYDPNYVVNPTQVHRRCTEYELMEKYLPLKRTINSIQTISEEERKFNDSPPEALQSESANLELQQTPLFELMSQCDPCTDTAQTVEVTNAPTQLSNVAVSSATSTKVMKPKKHSEHARLRRKDAVANLTIEKALPALPEEIRETRVKPDDYDQITFLSTLELRIHKPGIQGQMQRRCSKRMRRTVQSNECSVYHYGTSQNDSSPPPAKRQKRSSVTNADETQSTLSFAKERI